MKTRPRGVLYALALVAVAAGMVAISSQCVSTPKPEATPVVTTASLTHTPMASQTATRASPPTPTTALTPTPSPTATPWVDDTPMIRIPAGEFIMGSTVEQAFTAEQELVARYKDSGKTGVQYIPHNRLDTSAYDEVPQHTIYLLEFQIDQYEVTNAHYRRCVEAGECPLAYQEGNLYDPAYNDHPVAVNWEGADAYCRWAGKRLPTEAEWEKAARGTDGRVYPWGDVWQDGAANANRFDTKEEIDLAAVGSYPGDISPYGVMDMAGNVHEWVSDAYLPYPQSDYAWTPSEEYGYTLRGGSYATDRFFARTATRGYAKHGEGLHTDGFRCAVGPPQPTPTPLPPPAPTSTPDPGRDMVLVPAGEFLMGADEDDALATPGEKPQHEVFLDAFWIDRTEVTNAQYVVFLNAIGRNRWACEGYDCIDTQDGQLPIENFGHILEKEGWYVVEPGYEDYPVTGVTWYGADAYCRYYGLRLPTEAEWEKAARGTDGRRYPWGDEWDETRVALELSPVGSHAKDSSPYDVLDMAGNAHEWVADWYDAKYYSYSPYRNPQGPDTGTGRVHRGNLCDNLSLCTRTTMRWMISPQYGSRSKGFRCARSVGE